MAERGAERNGILYYYMAVKGDSNTFPFLYLALAMIPLGLN